MTIKHLSKLFTFFLTATLLSSLTACGGGGGESTPAPQPQAQAQKVTVTLGLQGSAATIVGSVDLDVVLPDGFVLETDSSNLPTASALTFIVNSDYAVANYTPETPTVNGAINSAIIKTTGFAGNTNLMQISRTYAVGTTLPTVDDFMVTVVASDLNGVPLTAVTAQVSISNIAVP